MSATQTTTKNTTTATAAASKTADDTMTLGQKLKNTAMTLEEKLAMIDAAMAAAQTQANNAVSNGMVSAPLDPQDLLMCEGCQ